jgi:hypothetical protein
MCPRRFLELVEAVRLRHPDDQFFDQFERRLASTPLIAKHYGAYEDAFETIDDRSWQVLMVKAIGHFLDHRKGQLKQGFFNQLNDAFAYEHLVSLGCQDVSILVEDGTTCPDISYVDDAGQPRFCEVKTINISEDEIARRTSKQIFSSADLYATLGPTYIKKLNEAMDTAVKQMTARGAIGLIYILVHFDDFTLDFFESYKQQIRECLASHSAPAVIVQVGVLGNYMISKP